MEKSIILADSIVSDSKRIATLLEGARKNDKEPRTRTKVDEEDEDIQRQKADCSKCRGDEGDCKIPHIEDLCSVDKSRISQLISHLTKCTQEKNEAQSALAVLQAENEVLKNRYEFYCNQSEGEKTQLKLQLSEKTSEFSKLRQRTSHYLDLLSKQIGLQEKEFSKIAETVKNLLREKIFLQNSLIEKDMRVRVAEAQIERMKEKAEMEKLFSLKEQTKNISTQLADQACQTIEDWEDVSLKPISSYSETGLLSSEKHSRLDFFQNTRQVQRPKSVNDLEEPSTDGNMIRDLFFKCPNISDSETLQIQPLSTFYQ
ncbi:uncharacterized protein LOC117182041 [Belonocnema kinseyi]|uniref:uncharacterized protein LOC117182041 n=1 Tax=Belonocnema kinseyi TaxID=2817044 RepID=UPI00143DE1D9|nr:uncharacterized protein LOC117182041 [Belonocnema kinseyi]